MTRINANIPTKFLSDHHLRAEQREILRIPRLFSQKKKNKTLDSLEVAKNFTLGEGHVLFFMDKGKFIEDRFMLLTQECTIRGINHIAPNTEDWWELNQDKYFYGEWKSNRRDNLLVVERIIDKMLAKLRERPTYSLSYYGQKETPETTIKRLLKSLI